MTAEPEQQSAKEAPFDEPTKTLRNGQNFVVSYVVIACIGFAALNVFEQTRHHDVIASWEKSSIWWATKNWRDLATKPDILLLGSSLMIAAQNDCDATFFDKSFDAVTHHHSMYLEDKLSQKKGRTITTASFVIGGQMASDAYAIISTLLKKDAAGKSTDSNKPETIVWGIAPRDFIDATFGNAQDTETVRLMNRFAEENDTLHLGKIPFWIKVQNSFSKICSLYRNREELRASQNDYVEKLLHMIPPYYSREMRSPPWLLHQAALAFPEDNRLGQWTVRPCKKKGNEPRDNSSEYKNRYNPFKSDQFLQQIRYYDETLGAVKAQGRQILIVNMPLTSENMQLIPAGVYARYLATVRNHAASAGARFLDLNTGNKFSATDFWDPVHLDGYGATKFMADIVVALSPPSASTGASTQSQTGHRK